MTDEGETPLYDALLGVAAREPGRSCLHTADGITTYGQLADRSASLAGALAQRGVTVGDRVASQVGKSVDAVALHLACIRSGVVHVPLNTAYTPTEVRALVDDAGAAVLVDDGVLADLVADDAPPAPVVPRSGDDPAAMLYTSGTTGRSKGALLSCRNLVANARALVDAWRFTSDDVLLHVLPIFHVHGLFVALHCALAVGAEVRFHERFDVAATRRDLRRSTVMMGVPTHYRRLLADDDLGRADCASVRLFTSGSAPLPAADHREFADRTGHHIVERYGMTETMILTSNPYDGDRVPGTVGFPLAGVELRVADDAGRPVGVGVDGTVEVRGDGVFLGYWGLPEATAQAFRDDGWFVTGDIGALDDEGRLTLHGRATDTVISGGLNVYPKEVEAVLESVTGVAECAVVGAPDPDLGEVVAAFVVLDPGAAVDEDLLAAACEGVLARFKHPRRYLFVDALPRNAMSKVQKTELRRRLA